MAIPILGEIEKLINEHGSAVILKERLALASDQYSALEQKLAASELRTKELESENQRLNVDLEKATVEIQNLKKLSEQAHSHRRDEVKEKSCVYSHSATKQPSQISRNRLGLARASAPPSGFFRRLENAGIECCTNSDSDRCQFVASRLFCRTHCTVIGIVLRNRCDD